MQHDTPENEENRLTALKELNVLDTPINKAFERITRLTKNLFHVPIVAISLIDSERQWFKSVQGLDVCETSREVSFCSHAILQDDIFIISDALCDPRFVDNELVTGKPHIRFYAGYPIRSNQEVKVGTLCIIDNKPRDFTKKQLQPLIDMAGLVEQELITEKKNFLHKTFLEEYDEIKRKSMIDPLTRLANRGTIEEILLKKITHSGANNEKFAVALFDIDDFKKINDHYGHNAGDAVLRQVAKTLLDTLRNDDILGRWGGEEFLAIINVSNKDTCCEIITRSLNKIQRTNFTYEETTFEITLTSGVTIFEPGKNLNIETLVDRIDKAMYQGKNEGKNKYIFKDS